MLTYLSKSHLGANGQRLAAAGAVALVSLGASVSEPPPPKPAKFAARILPEIDPNLLKASDTNGIETKIKPRDTYDREAALAAPVALAGNPQREKHCLATALYFEARGETEMGQKAVAEVILTRAQSGRYPRSICGVVYQNSHKHLACQFTFTCDGIADRPRDAGAWKLANDIAHTTLMTKRFKRPITKWATHYHADYVRPRWASKLTRTATVGTHIFYREFAGRRS